MQMPAAPPEPYCPSCRTLAGDMPALDEYCHDVLGRNKREKRANYVRAEEGTYNPVNGHFLCDDCYIKAGMPSNPSGWKCP